MAESPIARGLYLCETVIVEERTRNTSLVNIFTRRIVETLPTPPQQFVAFAILANGQGTIPLQVRVTRLQDDAVIYSQVLPVRFDSPLLEIRFVYRITSLIFPSAGRYAVELTANGDPLAATPIDVSLRGSPS